MHIIQGHDNGLLRLDCIVFIISHGVTLPNIKTGKVHHQMKDAKTSTNMYNT